MSKLGENKPNRTGLLTVLYRKPDAPRLIVDPYDVSNLLNEVCVKDYDCPCNTTLPLVEFLETREILQHLDSLLETNEHELNTPKRSVEDGDILIITRRLASGVSRAAFLLTANFDKEEMRAIVNSCSKVNGISMFPKLIGSRFCAVSVYEVLKDTNLIPELIDSTKPDSP